MLSFGLHTSSVVLSMLAIMGISALAFLWSAFGTSAVVVILYFISLTDLASRLYAQQGNRRHPLFFVGSDFAWISSAAGICRYADIGLQNGEVGVCGNAMQVVAFVLAILVRNSAAPAIAAHCGWRLVDRMETSP